MWYGACRCAVAAPREPEAYVARKPLLSWFSSTRVKVQQRTNTCAFNFSTVTEEQLNCYNSRTCGSKYYCRELSMIFVVICVVFLSHLCSRFLMHNAVSSLQLEVESATSTNVQF